MPPEAPFALVTGAGSGIGRALAINLSRRRGTTILTGRRGDALEETRRQMAFPDLAVCVPADITKRTGRESVICAVRETGHLDLLINNAGVLSAAPFPETSDADMGRMLATNVLAPFSLTRDLVPFLKRGTSAEVVNIGSMFGDIAFPQFVGYSMTKFALRGMSDGLRRELNPHGIGVVYAAPRAANTDAASAIAPLLRKLGTKLDEPVDVARHILTAVYSGKRTIYPTAKERFFVFLARVFPKVVDRSITGQFRKLGEADYPELEKEYRK